VPARVRRVEPARIGGGAIAALKRGAARFYHGPALSPQGCAGGRCAMPALIGDTPSTATVRR
jgi:hypothetical protein